MRRKHIAMAMMGGLVAISPSLYGQAGGQTGNGQTLQKPTPYSGVSQPPPDDTITVDDPAPAAAKLVTRPADSAAAASPAPATAISAPPPSAAASAKCNPDDRMIGDPSPCDAPVAEAVRPAAANDADADIVTFVPTRPGELPEGTIVRMALNEDLSSTESQAGADFTGRVTADVVSAGRVVIPQGAEVVGKVIRVTEGKRFGSAATIRLRPDVVVLPDGSRYVLRAQVVDTSSKSRVDGEGTLKPASRLKTNAIKEGAGIGTGAVAGALIGGGPGALVGSLIGAGVMTTNILVQAPAAVKVPKDSTLTLSLTQPMLITPAQQVN
jgi:hypothetical protein